MPSTMPVAGDSIEARCTKCRKNTKHTILAMAAEAPEKVQCGQCERQHKYRPPTAPRKTATRRTVDQNGIDRQEWADLRPGMNKSAAATYSMSSSYKLKSLVEHPLFGLGLVKRVVGPQKIEVLFEDGKKTMRCA